MAVNIAVDLQTDTMAMSVDADGGFIDRHIGPSAAEQSAMLKALGEKSLESFISKVVPEQIRIRHELKLTDFPEALSESGAILRLKETASKNKIFRSYIGMGYSGTITPPVIQRNILENPGWYTQYTPYQPEISQGRLEALLNFQTMIADLTGLPISNASLLDEGTAAAEAMSMAYAAVAKSGEQERDSFFVSEECHPQSIAVLRSRAEAIGIKVVVGNHEGFKFSGDFFGALVQYPTTFGEIYDYRNFAAAAHNTGALLVVAADLLSLAILAAPGEWGADIVVGNSQRFGVPMGYGGPHAAFLSTKDEYKRLMPGRLIGVSKDASGAAALRLSLQTREQHIRRHKATSNICTAQVLLAIMASMYAVYHGPEGIRRIAKRVSGFGASLAKAVLALGFNVKNKNVFDTVTVTSDEKKISEVLARAKQKSINLRIVSPTAVAVSLDETVTESDYGDLLEIFGGKRVSPTVEGAAPKGLERKSPILKASVFNSYHSETEFLRYVRRLEAKDLSLGTAMIPLGSCTMKLNATSEMLPVTWPEFGAIHPFAPVEQAQGYKQMFSELERALAELTGFDATSLQPNAGSQGEYAGLLAIKKYQESIGQGKRKVCLIPQSAHGTNPASAVMAGLEVVVVNCDSSGNIDLADLKAKAEQYKDSLCALMATYPSTHGVFEEGIREVSEVIHRFGGQVYMDGANLNALVGLSGPAAIGADVCHINLHKTFCIPHGGGGPGMGPICVKKHLAPFLPDHPVVAVGHKQGIGPVSAAPWGSSSILPIPWMYIAMMAGTGLTRATEVAILNANYIANRLQPYYPVLYRGKSGYVAHECILDLRQLKTTSGVEVEDVAKRLMDYGFHAPTISFPVVGTMMVEPTESESKAELDRFCEAMISIYGEIKEIEQGKADKVNNLLKNAPHTAQVVSSDTWDRPYSRERAAFPTRFTREHKFWPAVGRIDGAYGDKNLICTCPEVGSYSS